MRGTENERLMKEDRIVDIAAEIELSTGCSWDEAYEQARKHVETDDYWQAPMPGYDVEN